MDSIDTQQQPRKDKGDMTSNGQVGFWLLADGCGIDPTQITMEFQINKGFIFFFSLKTKKLQTLFILLDSNGLFLENDKLI